jgi:hypothetical protein
MGDLDDWDDFLTSLGSPGQPSDTPKPVRPETAEGQNEQAQNEADFASAAASESHTAVRQQSSPSHALESAGQTEQESTSNAEEPLLPGFEGLDAGESGTHDVETARELAERSAAGISILEASDQTGGEQSSTGRDVAAHHAGESANPSTKGHTTTASMHSYDVEAVLAEVAALQHSGTLPDHRTGQHAAHALSRNEAEGPEEVNAAVVVSGGIGIISANNSATGMHAS